MMSKLINKMFIRDTITKEKCVLNVLMLGSFLPVWTEADTINRSAVSIEDL